MGFVHDHIAWHHGNVLCFAIMPNDFQRPRIVNVLLHRNKTCVCVSIEVMTTRNEASLANKQYQCNQHITHLRNVDDSRAHERQPVHVCRQDGALVIDADSIQRALRKLLTGPFLDCLLGHVPNLLFEPMTYVQYNFTKTKKARGEMRPYFSPFYSISS
jgi:hypothetical protein